MKTTTLFLFTLLISIKGFSYCQVDTAYSYSYPGNGTTRDVTARYITSHNADSTVSQDISQRYTSGVFENIGRSLYTYNAAKQITNMTTQDFITATSSWQNSKQLIYTYTTGKLSSETRSNWNSTTNSWDNEWQNVYAYDGSGNLSTEGYNLWNTATSSWRSSTRNTKTYSPLLSQEILESYSPVTLTWRNTTKIEYTRNGLNQLSQTLSYNWNTTTSVWDLAKRNLYTYTGIFATFESEERKATAASSWQFYSKAFNRYNTSTLNLLERNYLEFDAVDNQWDSVSRYTYEYNATADLIARDNFYFFNTTSERYDGRDRTEYSCRALNVGFNEIETTRFGLYPNPSHENKVVINAEKATSYLLFDMSGKTLLAGELSAGENNIQLQDISPGIYLVKVGNSSKRFIKN